MKGWWMIVLSGWLSLSIHGATIIVEKGQDINSAIQQAVSGDTILIRNDFKICSRLILKDNIVLRGETRGECKLNFGDEDQYFIEAKDLNSVCIENLSLISIGPLPYGLFYGESIGLIRLNQVDFINGNRSVYCLNSRIEIQDCSFTNYQSCIELERSSGLIGRSQFQSDENCVIGKGEIDDTLRIEDNWFRDGKGIIYLNGIVMPCLIRSNRFDSPNSSTLVTATASPVIFSFNRVFFNQENTSLSINQAAFCRIEHNLFSSDGRGSAVSLTNITDARCINNTFYNFQSIVINYSSLLTFTNNIAYLQPSANRTAITNVGGFQNVIDYNDFYGFQAFHSGAVNQNLSVGNFPADPLFVSLNPDDSLNYLCLECNSPCMDQGNPDYDSGLEPYPGTRIDLGFTGGTARGCGLKSVGIDDPDSPAHQPDLSRPLVIFPQPGDGWITVRSVAILDRQSARVRIFRLSGEPFDSFWVNDGREFRINSTTWAAGVYLIAVETQNKRYTGKLIILH